MRAKSFQIAGALSLTAKLIDVNIRTIFSGALR
jgi:hypothetical protein